MVDEHPHGYKFLQLSTAFPSSRHIRHQNTGIASHTPLSHPRDPRRPTTIHLNMSVLTPHSHRPPEVSTLQLMLTISQYHFLTLIQGQT